MNPPQTILPTLQDTNTLLQKQHKNISSQFSELATKIPQIPTPSIQIFDQCQQKMKQKLLDAQMLAEEMEEELRIQREYAEIVAEVRMNMSRKENDQAEKWYQCWGYFQTNYNRMTPTPKNLQMINSLTNLTLLQKNLQQRQQQKLSQLPQPPHEHEHNLSLKTVILSQYSKKDCLSIYQHYLHKINQQNIRYDDLMAKYSSYYQLYRLLREQFEQLREKSDKIGSNYRSMKCMELKIKRKYVGGNCHIRKISEKICSINSQQDYIERIQQATYIDDVIDILQ